MRRAAPWLLGAAGVLLVLLGPVLALAADQGGGGLVFLSPEQFDQLRSAHRWREVGLLGRLAGTALLGAAGGWALARRGGAGRRAAVVLALVGTALALGGAAAVSRSGEQAVVGYGGSYEPLVCPGTAGCGAPSALPPWTAPASALTGGALLGAVTVRCRWGDGEVAHR